MKLQFFISSILSLTSISSGIYRTEAKELMSSTWITAWPSETLPNDVISLENHSGCICRCKFWSHVVCYGEHCSSVPRNLTVPEGITELHIKTTNINKLSPRDFLQFQYLETLQIDGNNHLFQISDRTFVGLNQVKHLSISYNMELKTLNPNIFEGLNNLEKLYLVKNGFKQIIDATIALRTQYLPNLRYLSLNENAFGDIKKNSFAHLVNSTLTELELMLCQIETIDKKSLNVFTKLTYLGFGDNLVNEKELQGLLEEMYKNRIPLEYLNLDNLGFRKNKNFKELLVTIAKLNVSQLVLSRNHIENLSKGLFPRMPNVKFLDLSGISALTMDPEALGQDILPNLTSLLLSDNKLPGIIPCVMLPQIRQMDLSFNSGGHSYFDVTSNSLSYLNDLRFLNLSYNRITRIVNSFVGLSRLEVLDLKNSTMYFITQGAFDDLKELRVLNLANNPFHPFNTFEHPIFNGLTKLETLVLDNCKIQSFINPNIFENLQNLLYLSIKNNELSFIDSSIITPLVSLIGLDLTDNIIQPWGYKPIFYNNSQLIILLFAKNRLNYITEPMMEDFENVQRLDISQNAFVCECNNFNGTLYYLQKQNIIASNTSLRHPYHICESPKEWRDKLLTDFLDDAEIKCLDLSFRLATETYVVLAIIITVSVLLSILSYLYRWHIRYWLFLVRMTFLRRHSWLLKKNKVHPGDFRYDVFVSYSHEDRNFIVRLVSMLENQEPFLKLCVYERDFEIGTVISDTVMDKVISSRRTLLIVSNAFAKSQWCLWEMQLAEYHRLFFKSNSSETHIDDPLIIIKLGPIAESNMTPTLKFLLKSRIYLEWSHDPKKEKIFWEKLRKSLNKSAVKA